MFFVAKRQRCTLLETMILFIRAFAYEEGESFTIQPNELDWFVPSTLLHKVKMYHKLWGVELQTLTQFL